LGAEKPAPGGGEAALIGGGDESAKLIEGDAVKDGKVSDTQMDWIEIYLLLR
jgi:hypothetical protein